MSDAPAPNGTPANGTPAHGAPAHGTPAHGAPAPPPPDAPLFDDFDTTSTATWMDAIRADLKGKDPEPFLTWATGEGIDVRAFYRRGDLGGLPHVPTGGPSPLAARTPTRVQGDGDAAAANAFRIRHDLDGPDLAAAAAQAADALARGATDLGLRLDAAGGVLRGLPLHRPDALARVLADVDLAATPLHLTGGPAALPLLAFLLAVADDRGTAPDRLAGSLDYDPAAALLRGLLPDAATAYDAAAALVTYRAAHGLPVRPLALDLRPVHDAGGTLVHELAVACAALAELMAQLTARGLAPADVAEALHVVVPVGTSYFLAIGKLRALRLLLPQVLGAFDAPVTPGALVVQAETSRRVQSLYGRHVNLLRGATAAAAAVIGGCDVLAVRPFEAPTAPGDAFGARLARNTALLLKHEAHLDQVADPSAGAYYVEQVTGRLARAAWDAFQQIEADGGLLDVLRAGTLHAQIAAVRDRREAEVAARTRAFVATNHYPDPTETRLEAVDGAPRPTDLARAGDGAPGLPRPVSVEAVRDAVAQGATLGDVLAALGAVPGEAAPDAPEPGDAFPAIRPLPRIRLAEPFEALRLRTERHAAAAGRPPTVFLLPIGPGTWRSARATFARNVYGVAGFRLVEPMGFDTLADGAEAALDAGADLVVLCSRDDCYADYAPALVAALRDAGSDALVVVAGAPDGREALEAAGVWGFVHKQSPLLQTLTDTQARLMETE